MMESNKEIDQAAVAIDVHDDKGLEGFRQSICAKVKESAGEPSGQAEEEEAEEEEDDDDGEEEEEQVAEIVQGLVKTIGDELAERKHLRQIQRKKDGPSIVIPRVPERLRKGEEDAYEPSVLSIGPYHMAKPELQPMQLHKWRFLQKILNRNPNLHLNDYVLAITSLEKRARSCYPENIHLNKSDFVKMLLLDGCFLVEYFLRATECEGDEIFMVEWIDSHVDIDLMLLENQIPFFILQCIYELASTTTTTQDHPPSSFTRIAINYYNEIYPEQKSMPSPPAAATHHLLHLYHMFTLWSPESNLGSSSRPTITFIGQLKSKFRSLLSSSNISAFNLYGNLKKKFSSTPETQKRVNMLPSATDLHEAGVKLKANWSPKKSILDVTFSSEGVLEIPRLIIGYYANSHFRNQIAFEQLYLDSELKFTAYVKFLRYLVNTPKDVALLYSNGIIENTWANEEEIVGLFNRLARGTSAHSTNYLHDLYEEVDRYCKTRRHRWRATLVRNYFGSPWSAFSLAAAVIFLLLSFLQTYCSMYSYFHHSP